MSNKLLILVRSMLVALSLAATFCFLVGMGSGIGAILFACGGVLTQLAALLWLPGIAQQAWQAGQLLRSITAGAALVTVLLISVSGSVSILSGLVDEQQQAAGQRQSLESLMLAKQESANRLIALDRVTKAQPILDEVAVLREQLATLPSPSGFYLAADRIGGDKAATVVTVVIVAVALLLDGITLLLGDNRRVVTVTQSATDPLTRALEGVIHGSASSESGQPEVTVPKQRVVLSLPENIVSNDPELAAVKEAIEAGELRQISVRNVRELLGCGQKKAMEVARIFREAQEQVELL